MGFVRAETLSNLTDIKPTHCGTRKREELCCFLNSFFQTAMSATVDPQKIISDWIGEHTADWIEYIESRGPGIFDEITFIDMENCDVGPAKLSHFDGCPGNDKLKEVYAQRKAGEVFVFARAHSSLFVGIAPSIEQLKKTL